VAAAVGAEAGHGAEGGDPVLVVDRAVGRFVVVVALTAVHGAVLADPAGVADGAGRRADLVGRAAAAVGRARRAAAGAVAAAAAVVASAAAVAFTVVDRSLIGAG